MFSGINLSLVTYSKDKVALQLPIYLRIFVATVAMVFLYVAVAIGEPTNESELGVLTLGVGFQLYPFPLVLFILTATGALFRDRWVWDRSSNRMQRQKGVLFWYRKKDVMISELTCVAISRLRQEPSLLPARHGEGVEERFTYTYMLSVFDSQDNQYRIETFKGITYDRLQQHATAIAKVCDIPIELN